MARGRTEEAGFQPFFRGQVATLVVLLAICLGGLLGALVNVGAARLFGVPVSSAVPAEPVPNALQIPWPIAAFAFAPVGLLVGVAAAAVHLWWHWRRATSNFTAERPPPDAAEPGGAIGDPARNRSKVADEYGTDYGDPDAEDYRRSRRRVASAWAVATLPDHAARVAATATAGMTAAIVLAELTQLFISDKPHPVLRGIAGVSSAAGLIGAGALVTVVRSAYQSPDRAGRSARSGTWRHSGRGRRTPLAPPCYGERAVPELVDRVRILTGTVPDNPADPDSRRIDAYGRNLGTSAAATIKPGPVLLTGYSQGSIIAPAVVAQLRAETREQVKPLTLACPARKLYARAFPGYFGPDQLDRLRTLTGPGNWQNVVRHSDYIGSWIFTDPGPRPKPDELAQLCLDPVTVTADIDPTPPPIHRHSNWWPDARVAEPARLLR